MINLEIVSVSKTMILRANGQDDFEFYNEHCWTPVSKGEIRNKLPLWLKDYSRITMFLEDLILVCPQPDIVVAFDTITAQEMRTNDWTKEQLCTVIRMSFLGDDENEQDYLEVEHLFANWPKECRLIP